MSTNQHTIERILRVVLGLGILSLILWMPLSWGISKWWGLVGLVPVMTGASGLCPLYSILRISTCKVAS